MCRSTLGNGLVQVRDYDAASGRLAGIQTGASGAVQDLTYEWDKAGNLDARHDHNTGKDEDFTYDALNRLEDVAVDGSPHLTVGYDAIGNITSKSDVGSYTYGAGTAGPHAVTGAGGASFGSMTGHKIRIMYHFDM